MYVKWEWNLKECVIFETFLHSLPHLFFWNINLLPYEKKKNLKFQPVISNTCPHYLTKHNTKNSASLDFLWGAIFFKGYCTCDLCMRSSGCVQCLFSVVSVLCFGDWFWFFFSQQVRPSTYTCTYTPDVTFIPNHWQRVCCYIDKNVSCYRKKET